MGGKAFTKYLRVWWILTIRTTKVAYDSRFGVIIFLLGKFLRLGFLLLFIVVLLSTTKQIAGFSLWEVIFFFATFNLVDSVPQFFLRGVYRFRSYIVSGDFDYFLSKPFSPFFRSLFGGSDVLDLSVIFLALGLLAVAANNISGITGSNVVLYILLLVNAFCIALAFHVFVVALGIITTEVDNTLWIYRDLIQMGRFPTDIYRAPLSLIITYIVPVGIMITFPAKALLGLLSPTSVMIAIFFSIVFLSLSLHFWQYALKHYTSASS